MSLQLCASLRARLCYSPYAEQFEQQRVLKSKASIVVLFLEQVDEALTGALASWRQQDSRYQARQVERLARKIERDGVCQFLIIGSYEQRRFFGPIRRNDDDGNPPGDRRLHDVSRAGAAARPLSVPNRYEQIDIGQNDLVGAFITARLFRPLAGQNQAGICTFKQRPGSIGRRRRGKIPGILIERKRQHANDRAARRPCRLRPKKIGALRRHTDGPQNWRRPRKERRLVLRGLSQGARQVRE